MGLGRMQAASIDATGPVYFHAAMDLCLVKRGETVWTGETTIGINSVFFFWGGLLV